MRKDGFSGEIALALKDAPKGFAISGARVPANQDQVKLTLKAPQSPLEEPCNLSIEGRATIRDREIVHQAVPAEDMMQAFIYHHLVPMNHLLSTVLERVRPRAPMKFLGEEPVKIPTAGTVQLKFSIITGPMLDQVQFTLNNPPEGIAVQNVSSAQEGLTLVLSADAGKVKPGLKGNLIIEATAERAVNPGSGTQKATKKRVSLGFLPAIPFEIVK